MMFIFLLFVACLIAVGFRLAVRFIPLEMWRLPRGVKQATIKTEGRYLKVCTLFIELETTLAFGYVMVSLYFDRIPGDMPVVIWALVAAATVVICGRYVLVAASKIR